MYISLFLAVLPVLFVNVIKAKIYDRCELSKDLLYKYEFPKEQISTWICIVNHESQFNTSAMNHGSGDHGLFQISQLYWCSTERKGLACNANCASFRDDDISDDVKCVKKIYKEHTKISGNGFTAWTVYGYFCKGDTSRYLDGCSKHEINTPTVATEGNEDLDDDGYHFPPLPKIYNRCSLAEELKEIHKVPMSELATWVCIAQHESSLNTAAINKGGDHGLFQISELFWCSTAQKGGGCNAKCSQFTDSNITDDFICARTIFKEHTVISGNGFNAWTVYPRFCNGDNSKYIGGCPGIDKIATNKTSKKLSLLPPVATNKVYQRCELAQELRLVHKIPENQISKWVCIAQHESNLNTSALGDGDHGIFQISEKYWCSPFGKGSGCYAKCEDFRDGDITDDIACAQTIYYEHVGISGDGFNAWAVYPTYCKGDTEQYINDCVNLEENNSIDIYPSNEENIPNIEPNLSELNYILQKNYGSNFKGRSTISNAASFFASSRGLLSDTNNTTESKDLVIEKRVNSPIQIEVVTENHLPTFKDVNVKPPFLTFSTSSIFSGLKSSTPSATTTAKSVLPKSRQLEFRTTQPNRSKPRPPLSQIPGSIGPSGKQRPSRPVVPPPRPGVPPPRPPINLGPSRPAGNGRPPTPRPPLPTIAPRPPPRPTTARPINWNNLPGAIFTLWPSSTKGPVSTSVYSTSPKPLPGPGLQYTNANEKKSPPASSHDGTTVKREQRLYEPTFPGYSFVRTKSGFRLVQSI